MGSDMRISIVMAVLLLALPFSGRSEQRERRVPWQGNSTLRYAPDGKLCQILLDGNDLTYRERGAVGGFQEEPIVVNGRPLRGEQPMLLFDAQGRPNIVDSCREKASAGWYRKSGGAWEVVGSPGKAVPGKAGAGIKLPRPINRLTGLPTNWEGYVPRADYMDRPAHMLWSGLAASFVPDGSLRILFCDEPDGRNVPAPTNTFFHLYLGSNAGDGSWRWTVVETFQRDWCAADYYNPPRYFSFVVDRQGRNHILYARGFSDNWPEKPRRKCSELRYVSDSSGQWRSEVVSAPLRATADAAWGASLAVDADGNLAVASQYISRGPGASPENSDLLFHRRQADGSWTREKIPVPPDGYKAADGQKGTGAYPYLVFDGKNLPHIVFCDFATQHWPKWHCMDYCGQIRYAQYDGTRWSVETLYRQTDPLRHQVRFPIVAVTDSELSFAGMRRINTVDKEGAILSIEDEYIEGRIVLPFVAATDGAK